MPNKIEYLIEGHRQFRRQYFSGDKLTYETLVTHGQNPGFLIVACSDSRVDPAIVLNCKPGDLFVVRNVANLVPPCEDDTGYHGTSAALEFSICELGINQVIVMGHSQCGGITSLFQDDKTTSHYRFVSKWMELAGEAKLSTLQHCAHDDLETKVKTCTQHAIIRSLHNLQTFSWVKSRVAAQQLFLHGWFFDLESGEMLAYQKDSEQFISLL